jgi:hypothetical protein
VSSDVLQPKKLPSQNEVGLRLSIRMHDPEGGFRDLLGILTSTSTVEKKDGTEVSFDPAKIALWKVVTTETTMRRKDDSAGS